MHVDRKYLRKYAFLFKITSKNMHKSKKYPRKICKNDIM